MNIMISGYGDDDFINFEQQLDIAESELISLMGWTGVSDAVGAVFPLTTLQVEKLRGMTVSSLPIDQELFLEIVG